MKSLVVALSAALAAALLPARVAATTDWSWSFNQSSINLAVQREIDVTVRNEPTSDLAIFATGLDIRSFGDFGLLYEPGRVRTITPTLRGLNRVLEPGQSASSLAIQFTFNLRDPPSPGVIYNISPSYFVLVGSDCIDGHQDGCTWESRGPTRPLSIFYAAVPEPGTNMLLLFGSTVLAGIVFLRGRANRALEGVRLPGG